MPLQHCRSAADGRPQLNGKESGGSQNRSELRKLTRMPKAARAGATSCLSISHLAGFRRTPSKQPMMTFQPTEANSNGTVFVWSM